MFAGVTFLLAVLLPLALSIQFSGLPGLQQLNSQCSAILATTAHSKCRPIPITSAPLRTQAAAKHQHSAALMLRFLLLTLCCLAQSTSAQLDPHGPEHTLEHRHPHDNEPDHKHGPHPQHGEHLQGSNPEFAPYLLPGEIPDGKLRDLFQEDWRVIGQGLDVPDFREKVAEVAKTIYSAYSYQGHCHTVTASEAAPTTLDGRTGKPTNRYPSICIGFCSCLTQAPTYSVSAYTGFLPQVAMALFWLHMAVHDMTLLSRCLHCFKVLFAMHAAVSERFGVLQYLWLSWLLMSFQNRFWQTIAVSM